MLYLIMSIYGLFMGHQASVKKMHNELFEYCATHYNGDTNKLIGNIGYLRQFRDDHNDEPESVFRDVDAMFGFSKSGPMRHEYDYPVRGQPVFYEDKVAIADSVGLFSWTPVASTLHDVSDFQSCQGYVINQMFNDLNRYCMVKHNGSIQTLCNDTKFLSTYEAPVTIVTFQMYRIVEIMFGINGGTLYRKPYNYPKEGQHVGVHSRTTDGEFEYVIAKSVGIFTWHYDSYYIMAEGENDETDELNVIHNNDGLQMKNRIVAMIIDHYPDFAQLIRDRFYDLIQNRDLIKMIHDRYPNVSSHVFQYIERKFDLPVGTELRDQYNYPLLDELIDINANAESASCIDQVRSVSIFSFSFTRTNHTLDLFNIIIQRVSAEINAYNGPADIMVNDIDFLKAIWEKYKHLSYPIFGIIDQRLGFISGNNIRNFIALPRLGDKFIFDNYVIEVDHVGLFTSSSSLVGQATQEELIVQNAKQLG